MTSEKLYLEHGEIEGQMDMYDLNEQEPEQSLIAVSKIFARAAKEMSISEWKTFVYALTRIKWTESNNNIVYLDKVKLAEIIGIDTSDQKHLSQNLYRSISDLPAHSQIKFAKEDKTEWQSGVCISTVKTVRGKIAVEFVPRYMGLFEQLNKENNYITMWAQDLFSMSSDRSILMYEDLRLHTDTRKSVNETSYTTQQLKEMFSIPFQGRGSYTNKDNKFNRTMFEKKVLQPIVDDLMDSRMINLCAGEDGKFWTKVKKNGHVAGYTFYWTFSSHPRVATAEEVAEINTEIEQNPQVLKVAKDIIDGKKKPASGFKAKNAWNDFENNKYDFDDLEEKLLEASRNRIDN